MRKRLVLGALVLAAAAPAFGAEIHGTVSENGKPLPEGVALALDCAGGSGKTTTDNFGSYSLKVAATGECRLSVAYKGASGATTVTVFDKPSRYDFAVAAEGGKLVLTRK
ncbi:MAG TPA: hypothetical protein VMN82_04660 [Thermoanaerobaculia bacterium]|nr:hypothetical protein [Thermoanaerobaculia bacterium]